MDEIKDEISYLMFEIRRVQDRIKTLEGILWEYFSQGETTYKDLCDKLAED